MPAQNPNANRSETAKPKPAKVRAKVKPKPPASPDQADRTRTQQQPTRRKPASKDPYRAPQEQQLLSQAHSVRVRARAKRTDQRGTSPSGDRPQGRSREMDASTYVAGPSVGAPKTPELPRGAQQRGTSPSGDRPQGRAQEMREAPTHPRIKPKMGPLKRLKNAPHAYVKAIHSGDANPMGLNLLAPAIKDAAELAVTTPSSVAKIVTTAATHPKKLPGMLAAPYIAAIKDPKKAITEHPVSTALMFAPAAKVPGRVVGKAARVAGKQTLERPAASLPGTALKEQRTGSRDVAVRAVQSLEDKKNPAPEMTVKQAHRRVDEFHDVAKYHRHDVQNAAARQVKERGLKGDDATEHVRLAVQGADKHLAQRFAAEFGATHQVTPKGAVVRPKNATTGTLHTTRGEADKVVARLNAKPTMVRTGHGEETAPLEFVVRPAGDKFVAVPKFAAERLMQSRRPNAPQAHSSVGSGRQIGAKVLRRSRHAFTQAVLPLSPKWLAGQGTEAALRSVVAGAGPMDLLRMNKVVKRLNRETPGLGDEVLKRVSGGQFGLTGTAREYAGGKSLAEDFAGTSLERPAKAATRAGQTPPLRIARKGWTKYTNTVLDTVNGAIENTARKAMAGHEIKTTFMERHIVGLTDKALDDAARGLRGTESQAALGRSVDRMYGQYSKFSPERRSALLHWTPFLPWYLNVATFLTKVLPKDHPVKTALLADMSMATEDWRKAHHLSLKDADHVPGFLLGSYPGKGDSFYRIGHYVPFAPADPVEAAGSLALPQLTGTLLNTLGIDWTGHRLKRPGYKGKEFNQGERTIRALVTAAESQIPGVSQAGRISGLTPRLVDKKDPDTIPTLTARLKKELPTTPTKSARKKVRGRVQQAGVKLPNTVGGVITVPGGAGDVVQVPGG